MIELTVRHQGNGLSLGLLHATFPVATQISSGLIPSLTVHQVVEGPSQTLLKQLLFLRSLLMANDGASEPS
ncbi:hypothetical protein HAX54_039428, partial [Datura stramonium]|nr:hypothetical protein [Datura stramonium]